MAAKTCSTVQKLPEGTKDQFTFTLTPDNVTDFNNQLALFRLGLGYQSEIKGTTEFRTDDGKLVRTVYLGPVPPPKPPKKAVGVYTPRRAR